MRKLGLSLASLTLVALLVLLAGSASAYVLLSPNRTWDCAPDYIVDNRAGGVPSILDADGGRTKTLNAITSNADAWNSESSGTVIKAHAGSVAGFALGDSIPMLNFTDPLSACTGTCLAATFTVTTASGAPVRVPGGSPTPTSSPTRPATTGPRRARTRAAPAARARSTSKG
ncbi:MAG TPA: hypothetical protein VNJ70_11240 [Thermoanaerobaculia bacterium]|nr:hypothetical protein [Thermoanaerobaculia bacterium]